MECLVSRHANKPTKDIGKAPNIEFWSSDQCMSENKFHSDVANIVTYSVK